MIRILKSKKRAFTFSVIIEYTADNNAKYIIKFDRAEDERRGHARIFDEYNQQVFYNAFTIWDNNKYYFYGHRNDYFRGIVEDTFNHWLDIVM